MLNNETAEKIELMTVKIYGHHTKKEKKKNYTDLLFNSSTILNILVLWTYQ